MIQRIKEHEFQGEDHLLLDANVWLYTYGPSDFRSGDKDHIYNDAMTEMIKNKSDILPGLKHLGFCC